MAPGILIEVVQKLVTWLGSSWAGMASDLKGSVWMMCMWLEKMALGCKAKQKPKWERNGRNAVQISKAISNVVNVSQM